MGARLHPQIVAAFAAGVTSEPNATAPYLWSSECWEAWMAGRELAALGYAVEGLARKTRSTYVARLSCGAERSARISYGKGGLYTIWMNGAKP